MGNLNFGGLMRAHRNHLLSDPSKSDLPGFPVSAFFGFEVFIRPALLQMSGVNNMERTRYFMQLAGHINFDGRESFLRGKIWYEKGQYYARFAGHQRSEDLYFLIQSNALLIVPSEVKSLPIGAEIDAWLYD